MKNRLTLIPGALIIFLQSCSFGDDYKQISHREFLKTHKYSIGQVTLEFNDEKRKRPVKTEIWYPTMDTTQFNVTSEYPFKLPPTSKDASIVQKRFPLILLSHGTGGNRISQMWLACEIASTGYIVAAVNHFGNTLDNKIPEYFVKVWHRPLDISFVIDNLLTHSTFSPRIDTAKIGMAGFSLGGYTTIALAGGIIDYKMLKEYSGTAEGKNEFNVPELGDVSKLITTEIIEEGNGAFRYLKDERISAFVAMAPAIGQGFQDESQFSFVNSPVLIIGAENDKRAPVNTNAKHYKNLIKSSEYIELEGKAGHYIFMNEAKTGLKRSAPSIFKDDEAVNRRGIHNKVAKIVIDFFDRRLNGKSK